MSGVTRLGCPCGEATAAASWVGNMQLCFAFANGLCFIVQFLACLNINKQKHIKLHLSLPKLLSM